MIQFGLVVLAGIIIVGSVCTFRIFIQKPRRKPFLRRRRGYAHAPVPYRENEGGAVSPDDQNSSGISA